LDWVRKNVLPIVAGTALLASATAAYADVLVARVLGPAAKRFKPGTVLRDDARIVLGANDTLVLLDERGTRTLRGPGTYTARAARTASTQIAARVPAWNQQRRARIGAVRSVPSAAASRPNLWLVDIAAGGVACVVDPAALTLWRSDATVAGKTLLTGPDGSAEIQWSVGQATQAWPASLGFRSGAVYRIGGTGAAPGGTAVTLKLLASTPATSTESAAALISADCEVQLNLMLSRIGEAPAATP